MYYAILFSSALGYAEDVEIVSSKNVPPFPASIKDGYAIRYDDSNPWSQVPKLFNVVQVSVAGTDVRISISTYFNFFVETRMCTGLN